jgi:hypothetical protein
LFFLALLAFFAVKLNRVISFTANLPTVQSSDHQKAMKFAAPAQCNPFVDFVIFGQLDRCLAARRGATPFNYEKHKLHEKSAESGEPGHAHFICAHLRPSADSPVQPAIPFLRAECPLESVPVARRG